MVKTGAYRDLLDLRLAFALRAHARCYDLVELDVVAAKDDEPALFHDGSNNLHRLCSVDGFQIDAIYGQYLGVDE